MRIREWEMMTEVVARYRDETSYEIIFRALKRLELHCLQSLTSFCSRNYTLRFPSLEQLTETNFRGRWASDLNATVEQLYK
ncbi:hypothetical protein Goshw_008353 [Gossypium schwendimanii]|uniref:Uncharacterized protein n=1 Tax=Gossypium schwendimanii TaxID=34291 RepID=A0A7J9N4B2_GOSSC|nr:hypothetical protein [Gossypium schwendimanii]